MADNTGFPVIGPSGNPLKAHFDIVQIGRFQIDYHSMGGTKGSPDERNHGYAAGLQQLLRQLGRRGSTVVEITVVSDRAMKTLPDPADRRLDLPFPIPLNAETDVATLQGNIGKAQKSVGSRATTPSGGNRTRHICLTMDVPGVGSGAELLAFLGN